MAENGGFLRLPGRTFSTFFYEFLLTPFGGHLKENKNIFLRTWQKIFILFQGVLVPNFVFLCHLKTF